MSKRSLNVSMPLPDSKFFDETFVKKRDCFTTCSASKIRKCPPTPRPNRCNSSRSLFENSAVNLISVHNKSQLSPLYKESNRLSYFQQCFHSVEKIGEGSFGEVFRAKSIEDGYTYAVKVSKDTMNISRTSKLLEVCNMKKIPDNEYCIKLFHAWEEQDRLFMQLEYCGMSLDKYAMENTCIKEAQLWDILIDVLLGLKNIHDNGLIHMDVKPENIMLCSNGVCKLGDFGLLTDSKKGGKRDLDEGDARYLAPEAMNDTVTPKVDVFSLGITMLELATNLKLPGNGPLWEKLRNEYIPDDFKNEVSEDFYKIIVSMMKHDYRKRPSVNKLLGMHPIRKLLENRKHQERVNHFKKYILSIFHLLWTKIITLVPWIHPQTLWQRACKMQRQEEEQNVTEKPSCSGVLPKIVINSPIISLGSSDRDVEKRCLIDKDENGSDDFDDDSGPPITSTPVKGDGGDVSRLSRAKVCLFPANE